MSSVAKISGEQLEDAFQLFNQMSEKLALSYGELENRVAQLSGELAEARSERLKQLAEKEVLASRLEGLLNALPAAIIVIAADNRITQVNAIAEQMFGENLEGQTWTQVAQNAIHSIGDELQLKDGRWVSISTQTLQAEPGKIILITDISETRGLQDVVNRQQRLTSLGEMLASLAHQIRTPLASALLYLSNVAHPGAQQQDRIRYTEKSRECLHHLNRMVNDMLTFARGGDSSLETIELAEFIEQFQALLKPQLTEAGAQLTIENTATTAQISGNRDALLGALQNLASNALAACEENNGQQAELNLSVAINATGMLEMRFSDNGGGIEDDIRERILEPFFTTRSMGTGLGLAVVNATINSHFGSLKIHSVVGEGSCFIIQLPLCHGDAILPSKLDESLMQQGQQKCIKNDSNYFHQVNEVKL